MARDTPMRGAHELLRDGLGKVYTAASARVLLDGKPVFSADFAGVEAGPHDRPQAEPVFDLASLTKIFTTTAILRLADAGLIGLEDPVCAVLPAFVGPRSIRPYPNPLDLSKLIAVVPPTEQTCDAGRVTFEQLLTHSSGLPAWLNLSAWRSPAERIEACLHAPFAYPTGSRALYSDIGFIVLGKAIERLTGLTLDEAIAAWVTRPLGLGARYGWIEGNAVPTEVCPGRGRRLIGEVHDENCAALGGVAGHAGLFGTAAEVAELGQFYLDRGRGLIRPALIEDSTRRHIADRGLGWVKPSKQGSTSGRYFSPESFGHTGFTGTSLWVDPTRRLVCALLTNRVFFGRDPAGIASVRARFHDAVIEALEGGTPGSS